MSIVYLALGSNLGNRRQYIRRALEELKRSGVELLKVSELLETGPFEAPAQGKFLNAVLKGRTRHSPEELIDVTKAIEHKLGRTWKTFRGPRVIDIDILLYDDVKLTTPMLLVPHPRMLERAFVMRPLQQIDPRLCASLKP
ncbi:MAG: 2-amino-4-hydroxy-6-hydroxymethyldihydropteridine diphosphokinase [Candidatus Omnitrophica bacterium]|nr:2-amino-4-hydroxy-6-hydroxymethyldihydropteridine diphosphokinase [Candidatus Omnitrophota bacterium]MDE2009399.1 2-amino-4-hydroxy-6-hydroxymethyldihydropteridine diphosphokinase [Candidatus Omnitrophota bacterium]MDE2214183.1 2-amino-4-hydroxy-6-hydroxymethyldihydropteridine diphosphokinase [Candidatus Omnitrophota bacterium]MDE2231220.1 2-amino-4-hydroxy-6-hydroxymethyldihydropteridine diphosphokinase [Candidatus Omnitrophota bacterium]